ncbi:hypothetical protein LCGC14_0336770 [marine sediment metagenome]|uniref:Uncharacterized protein n=1 Tax=marine sediment metagenome TaxID=412755 RepID=A0A0F9TY03_9ZZZZ
MSNASDYIGQMPDDFVDSFDEAAGDDLLVEFVNLGREKAEIEKRLDKIKERASLIGELLLEDWANRGVQSVKLQDRTVYIRHDFYCSKKGGIETQKVCDALRANGYGDMVNPSYAPASLKALVREMVDSDQPVPVELGGLIRFDTIPRLMTRAS